MIIKKKYKHLDPTSDALRGPWHSSIAVKRTPGTNGPRACRRAARAGGGGHTPVLRHRPAPTRFLGGLVRAHKLSINNKLEQPHARHRPVVDALRSHATLAEHAKEPPVDGLVTARVAV